jgi:hypothetical protein
MSTRDPYPGFMSKTDLETGVGYASLHPHWVDNHRYCGGTEENCDQYLAAKRAGLDPAYPKSAGRAAYIRRRDAYLADRGLTVVEWIAEERRLRAEERIAAMPESLRETYRRIYEHEERQYVEWIRTPDD